MTVGEKIQKLRKDFGMSQETLGQKLLVSRQTISLWEKDQTVPSIDHLKRLQKVFEVSVDTILGVNPVEQVESTEPNEVYHFHYTEAELQELSRLDRKIAHRKPFLSVMLAGFLCVLSIFSPVSAFSTGFSLSVLLVCTISFIRTIHVYRKSWKSRIERACHTSYEYLFFQDRMAVSVLRNHECVQKTTFVFSELQQITKLENWIFLHFGQQVFLLKQSDLKDNSAVFSFMHSNPEKTKQQTIPDHWQIVSVILFSASLLSILGALALVNAVSHANGLFVENLWFFFLLTPIPLASTVYGFVLKVKGRKYKKNMIAGLIMLCILCIYGSFTFVF